MFLNLPLAITFSTGIDQYSLCERSWQPIPFDPPLATFVLNTTFAFAAYVVFVQFRQYVTRRLNPDWDDYTRNAVALAPPILVAILPSFLLTAEDYRWYYLVAGGVIIIAFSAIGHWLNPNVSIDKDASSNMSWRVAAITIGTAIAVLMGTLPFNHAPVNDNFVCTTGTNSGWSSLDAIYPDLADYTNRYKAGLRFLMVTSVLAAAAGLGGGLVYSIKDCARRTREREESSGYRGTPLAIHRTQHAGVEPSSEAAAIGANQLRLSIDRPQTDRLDRTDEIQAEPELESHSQSRDDCMKSIELELVPVPTDVNDETADTTGGNIVTIPKFAPPKTIATVIRQLAAQRWERVPFFEMRRLVFISLLAMLNSTWPVTFWTGIDQYSIFPFDPVKPYLTFVAPLVLNTLCSIMGYYVYVHLSNSIRHKFHQFRNPLQQNLIATVISVSISFAPTMLFAVPGIMLCFFFFALLVILPITTIGTLRDPATKIRPERALILSYILLVCLFVFVVVGLVWNFHMTFFDNIPPQVNFFYTWG
ncbi:hypothetical protein F4X33_00215, partial [Candidatus Poribacteria bacterium]|nr:hypothetical protein [Candidatus Poribacteria bacterium]